MDKKTRLRIAFVNQPFLYTSFPNPGDSIGIVTAQIVRRLAPNCDVIVYTPTKGKTLQKTTESHEGVDYQFIPTVSDKLLLKIINKIPGIFTTKKPDYASSFYYFTYGLIVANELKKQKIDIVHLHNFSQFIPIIRSLNPKIKIVLHMHCQWLSQLDRDAIAPRLKYADLIVGCSEFITEKVRQQFPEFASKCQTVYNGVDSHFFSKKETDEYAEQKDIKKLLFVGRVSPEKGVHVLLEAFNKVVEQFPNVSLDIVGGIGTLPKEFIIALSDDDPKVANLISFYTADPVTGETLSYYEQLQKLLSPEASKRVTFCGSVSHKKLDKYYRDADIYINSSLSEALGMPILEAMAGSLPVVGSRIGGIPEAILNEKTGFVFESGDSEALAEASLRLLRDDNLRLSMGEAGHQRAVELFSWDRIVEKLLARYENL
ncbi:MAG: glycosyltransferase family 4 protein [Hydrococcus sp. Prado102]|jgi:glycosyltransferase involved in cell wall biosynthesis|nr:glycosyltransferase family 4 protein [Hydrococcus sp. Prado102]